MQCWLHSGEVHKCIGSLQSPFLINSGPRGSHLSILLTLLFCFFYFYFHLSTFFPLYFSHRCTSSRFFLLLYPFNPLAQTVGRNLLCVSHSSFFTPRCINNIELPKCRPTLKCRPSTWKWRIWTLFTSCPRPPMAVVCTQCAAFNEPRIFWD